MRVLTIEEMDVVAGGTCAPKKPKKVKNSMCGSGKGSSGKGSSGKVSSGKCSSGKGSSGKGSSGKGCYTPCTPQVD